MRLTAVPARLAAFALALLVTFGAGWAVGAALDDDGSTPPAPAMHEGHDS